MAILLERECVEVYARFVHSLYVEWVTKTLLTQSPFRADARAGKKQRS